MTILHDNPQIPGLEKKSLKKTTKLPQDWIILSLIIAYHRLSLTEVSKNLALNKNDFHVAFLGDWNYLPPVVFSSLSGTIASYGLGARKPRFFISVQHPLNHLSLMNLHLLICKWRLLGFMSASNEWMCFVNCTTLLSYSVLLLLTEAENYK